jgi:hypothetical protein
MRLAARTRGVVATDFSACVHDPTSAKFLRSPLPGQALEWAPQTPPERDPKEGNLELFATPADNGHPSALTKMIRKLWTVTPAPAQRRAATHGKRRVWRISDAAPQGEWVDQNIAPMAPVPLHEEPATEASSSGWFVSSMDLLNGIDVNEDLDTSPDDLFDSPTDTRRTLPKD